MKFQVKMTDYSDDLQDAMQSSIERALTRCGNVAVDRVQDVTHVITGNLRNSIDYKVKTEEDAVYVGTNVAYAAIEETRAGHSFLKRGMENGVVVYKKIIEDELKRP